MRPGTEYEVYVKWSDNIPSDLTFVRVGDVPPAGLECVGRVRTDSGPNQFPQVSTRSSVPYRT